MCITSGGCWIWSIIEWLMLASIIEKANAGGQGNVIVVQQTVGAPQAYGQPQQGYTPQQGYAPQPGY